MSETAPSLIMRTIAVALSCGLSILARVRLPMSRRMRARPLILPKVRDPAKTVSTGVARWHQTLKNRILLENYYLPKDLERQIDAFVEHYNHVRYHESIDNVTPADVYFGRADMIIAERRRIKLATIANRRLQHRLQAA
jgi:hypothetical protein